MKHILLKGGNTHTLEGNIKVNKDDDSNIILVKEESQLKHEQITGVFAEHNTLLVEPGKYFVGRQVEYNPFEKRITQIWD